MGSCGGIVRVHVAPGVAVSGCGSFCRLLLQSRLLQLAPKKVMQGLVCMHADLAVRICVAAVQQSAHAVMAFPACVAQQGSMLELRRVWFPAGKCCRP